MTKFDAIVVGLGAMGSATVFHLARQGTKVLGLEMYRPGHSHGSSHGHSRIIREAYFEAPEYVPLVQRAYELWRELEAESGQALLTVTGGLNIGRPESELVSGSLASARQHKLSYEYLNTDEVASRFSDFRLKEGLVAVYEPNAGILGPEACNIAHLELAARYGAELHYDEPVTNWAIDGAGVKVETAAGTYFAERLVITTGPWASELLAGLGLPLTVRRLTNAFFEPDEPEKFGPERCPVYLFDVPEGVYYGFPALPGQGLKLGRLGRYNEGEICTPQTIRRTVDEAEIEDLREMLDCYMPGANGRVKGTLTCMYTSTPDDNFILDTHPHYPQVVFGAGCGGHAFKFSSVIGEVLAELAVKGRSRHSIAFLSAKRFEQIRR